MEYGIKVKDKKGQEKVLVIGRPYEYRKGTPVFAVADDEDKSSSHLLTAAEIKHNWSAWASDLFSGDERITLKEAEKRGIEIL